MKKTFLLLTLTLVLTLAAGSAWAVQVPNNFQSGQPAYADSVDANFETLEDATNAIQYSYMGTQYYNIIPSDFIPSENGDGYRIHYYYLYSSSGTGTFYAPVHLPQGAEIQAINVSATDTSSTGRVRVILYKVDLGGSAIQTIALDSPLDSYAGGLYTTTVPASGDFTVVDNSQRSYLVQAYFNGGVGFPIRLHTVQIEYLMPTIRPTFFMPIIYPTP